MSSYIVQVRAIVLAHFVCRYVTAVPLCRDKLPMEAEVLNHSNGCQPDEPDRQLTKGISFSKELISFSLYGKIPRKSSKYCYISRPIYTRTQEL